MPVKVIITGLPRGLNNIDLVRKVSKTPEGKKVFVDAAHIVRKYARHFAPFDRKRKKGTHLRDAILVSPGPKLFTNALVTVRYKRPGAPHAHLIEFGTVKMPAKPYMRPAASTSAAQVQTLIHQRFRQLVKETPK